MSTIVYPDGSSLTSTALTDSEIQTAIQNITAQMLGLSTTDPTTWSKVRIGWEETGQPGFPIDTDTIVVRASTDEDEYSQTRDLTYSDNADGVSLNTTDVFTRCWRVFWSFIGPNATDNARAVRSALMKIDFVADFLAQSNLYLIPDIPEPNKAPREFQGQWWQTVDMEARFYEQITEVSTVSTVAQVEVKVNDKDGQIADITVTLP